MTAIRRDDRRMRSNDRFLVWAAWLAMTTACAGGDAAPAAPIAITVESLIGDAACDTDAQCRTVAVGAKACGGPAAYLPWSARQTDGAQLQATAGRATADARTLIEKSGVMSNCSIVIDPGAYCAPPSVAVGASSGAGPTLTRAVRQCRLRPASGSGASKIY